MDQNVKNRLVGVIVIFALAVIFLPMILDGSGVRKQNLEVVIPPQPVVSADPGFDNKILELQAKVEALPQLQPHLIDENSPKPVPEQQQLPENSSAALVPVTPEPVLKKAVQKPQASLKTISGGDSWVLQVGSFLDRNKALTQRDKLRKSNIAAVFIEQFDLNDKSNYRVRLGPFINRDQTKVARNKIKAKHDIDGIIMKYER